MSAPLLVELIDRLIDALETSGLDYALGGAFALSYWSEPRATQDVDITVYIDVTALDSALEILERAGAESASPTAHKDAERDGLAVLRAGATRGWIYSCPPSRSTFTKTLGGAESSSGHAKPGSGQRRM